MEHGSAVRRNPKKIVTGARAFFFFPFSKVKGGRGGGDAFCCSLMEIRSSQEVSKQVIHRFDTVRVADNDVLVWAQQLTRSGILHKLLREPLVVSQKAHGRFLRALDEVASQRQYPSTPIEQAMQDQSPVQVEVVNDAQLKALKIGVQWFHWEDKLRLVLEVLFLYKDRAEYMHKSPYDLPLQARQVVMGLPKAVMVQHWGAKRSVPDPACILSMAFDLLPLLKIKRAREEEDGNDDDDDHDDDEEGDEEEEEEEKRKKKKKGSLDAEGLKLLILSYYLYIWRDHTDLPISLEMPMLEWFSHFFLYQNPPPSPFHKEMTPEEKRTIVSLEQALDDAKAGLAHKATLLRSYLCDQPFAKLSKYDQLDHKYIEEIVGYLHLLKGPLAEREKAKAAPSDCPQAFRVRLNRTVHYASANARKLLLDFCLPRAFQSAVDATAAGGIMAEQFVLFYNATAAELAAHVEDMQIQFSPAQLELRVNNSFHPCTLVLAPPFRHEAARLRAWALLMATHQGRPDPELELFLLAPYVLQYLSRGYIGWALVLREWLLVVRPLAKKYISYSDMTDTLCLIDQLLRWLQTVDWVLSCTHLLRWLLDWENPGAMAATHFKQEILPQVQAAPNAASLYPNLLSGRLFFKGGLVLVSRPALFELCRYAMTRPLDETGTMLWAAGRMVHESACSFVPLPCGYPFEDAEMVASPETYSPRVLLNDETPFIQQAFTDSIFAQYHFTDIPHATHMDVLHMDLRDERRMQRWFALLVNVELFQRTGGKGQYVKWFPRYFNTWWKEAPEKKKLLPVAFLQRTFLGPDSTDVTPVRVPSQPETSPIYERYAPFLSRPLDPRLVEQLRPVAVSSSVSVSVPVLVPSSSSSFSPTKKLCVRPDKEPGELDPDSDHDALETLSCPVVSMSPVDLSELGDSPKYTEQDEQDS